MTGLREDAPLVLIQALMKNKPNRKFINDIFIIMTMKKGVIESGKGQVTIFIIIAIAIVALGAIVYMFYPQLKASFGFQVQNPEAFLQSCLEEDVLDSVDVLSPQGGSLNPTLYMMYDNSKVEYLCYTNEYNKLCTMQQPMLKEHIEAEIKGKISSKVASCLSDMKTNLEKQGYSVILREGDYNVELLPKRVVINFDNSLSLKRGDDVSTYEGMNAAFSNNIYEFVSIAISILDFEATYGDSETTAYMNYYRDLKVEKTKMTDGSKVYVLSDRNTGYKFQFATRSMAWPAGYGLE